MQRARRRFRDLTSRRILCTGITSLVREREGSPVVPRRIVTPRRAAPPLPAHLRSRLLTVTPSVHLWIHYYPCLVTLRDGSSRDRVYLVEEGAFLKVWGDPPMFSRDDRDLIDLRDVVDLVSSPTRMPARLANELYRGGESGMGYYFFGLRLRDGRTLSFMTGGAFDFLPDGLTEQDVIGVVATKRPSQESEIDSREPHYAWCLYRDETLPPDSTNTGA
jgi:hypothetical protein